MQEIFNKDLEELNNKHLKRIKEQTNKDEQYNNWNEKYTKRKQ